MSNLGLELQLGKHQIPFARANVGDRYVVAEMGRLGWQLGGESSGHVVCGHATGTGDGIVTALQVVAAMRAQQADLQTLASDLSLYPQRLINVPVKRRVALDEQPDIQAAVSAAEETMGDRGRVLLRPSGTEPLIRVMVEADNTDLADLHAESIAKVVQDTLAN